MVNTNDPTTVLLLLFGGVMLLLYGVRLVTDAMERALGARLRLAMMTLAKRPFAAFVTGVITTVLTQSSSATASVLVGLVSAQLIPLTAALAITLGANVGTTIAPLLTALNSGSITGLRLAYIYVGTRLFGAAVALMALNPLTALLSHVPLPIAAQVSFFHLGFNLLLAIFFAPLVNQIAHLATTLVREPATVEQSGARYLDFAALPAPAVALGLAMREILRMGDLAGEMLQLSIHAFEDGSKDIPKRIAQLDDHLDEIEIAIKRYLTQLNGDLLTQEQANRAIALLYICTDLEAIGDIVDKQVMRLAKRQRRKQIAFSDEEWNDLTTYHSETISLVQQALAGLASFDSIIANEVLLRRTSLNQTKRELHLQHLHRLRSGAASSLDASAIHLEMVNAISRVISHTSSIARAVLGEL